MNGEEKSLVATVLSLASGVLFLFVALLLNIPQPLSLMMVSSVLTIFVSFFMYIRPEHHTLYGLIVIVCSLISFLTVEVSAPWHHIILWDSPSGTRVFYQPDLSRHILSGIPPVMLGVAGGAVSIIRFRFQTKPTPKNFLKKCIKCDREIPIASEECPYCGTKQP